jgi:hypothetical protein
MALYLPQFHIIPHRCHHTAVSLYMSKARHVNCSQPDPPCLPPQEILNRYGNRLIVSRFISLRLLTLRHIVASTFLKVNTQHLSIFRSSSAAAIGTAAVAAAGHQLPIISCTGDILVEASVGCATFAHPVCIVANICRV